MYYGKSVIRIAPNAKYQRVFVESECRNLISSSQVTVLIKLQ